MFMFIGPILGLFLILLNVIVFYLNGEGCGVLGSRLSSVVHVMPDCSC